MKDKIITRHPQGKKGVRIDRSRYDQMAEAILESVKLNPGITFTDLGELLETLLAGHFEGSIMWYFTTVKLDLEARGLIERIPKTSPHQIRMKR